MLKKRLLSMLLCLCMVVGMLPTITPTASAAGTGITDRLNQLKGKYPDGTYWTVNGGPCPEPDADYNHLDHSNCKYYDGASECMGFARLLFYEIFGIYCSSLEGQKRYDRENVTIGDYVRLDNNSHSAIVTGRNGNQLTLAECNFGGRCQIKWGNRPQKYEVYISNITFFIHAPQDVYDRVNGAPSQPPASSYTSINFGTDFYAVIRNELGDFALTNASGKNGETYGNVQIETERLYDPRQIWYFAWDNSRGAYKIRNEYDGLCLDVFDARDEIYNNIGVWESNDTIAQRWKLVRDPDSQNTTFNMLPICTNRYVADVEQAWAVSGTNVRLDQMWHNNAQKFSIAKYEGYWPYTKPGKPSIPTFRSISATPERTWLSWSSVPTVGVCDEREYILDIWDGTNERYAIRGKRVAGTSCEVVLPVGKYQAYVRAVNTKYADWKSDWRGLDFNVYPFRTVTMTAIPAEGGTVNPTSELYSQGDYNTLVAKPNEGWKVAGWTRNGQPFNGWTGDPEKWTEYGLTITADETFTVTFERLPEPEPPIPAYAVSVSATEGGSVSGGGTYDEGTSVTVTAEAHEGYDFKGWREGSNIVSTAASYTFKVTGARNLTAVFEAKPLPKYTVNVTASPASGGSVSGGGSGIEQGASVTVTATANAGYTFKYWQEDGRAVSSDASYTFAASEDRALTAVFEAIPVVTPPEPTRYTITVSAGTGGTVSGGGTYDENQQVTITATPASGYRFVEWRENGVKVSENSSYSVTASGNRTFTAVFERLPVNYTVSVAASGSGTVTGGGSYREGTSVTVTAAPASGYRFVEWRENNTKVSDSTSYSFSIDKNRTLTATFEKVETPPVSYIVSLNATPGGTVTGSGSYEENTAVTVTAAPAEGYHFVEWQEDGETISDDVSYQFTITSNRTLRAIFAPDAPDQAIRYSVEVSAVPAEGGTVTGEGIFDEAAEVTVTATAREGYHFLHWIADGNQVSANQQYTFTVSESLSLTAVFEKETSEPAQSFLVTVSASPEEGGTVSGGGSYQAGAFVDAAATPNNGYRFVRWMENGSEVSSDSRYTFSAATNRTLIAVFEKVGQPSAKTYSVNVSANSPAGGTVSGGGTFAENNIVTVTANANSGYRFTGWFENGSQVSASVSYTFTVSADRTLVAGFTYVGGSTNPGGNPGTNTPSSNPGDRPSGNNTGNTSTTQPSLPVITSGADSGVTTTASPNATIRGDTAASIITSAIAQEIIKQATTNNSGEVIIAPVVRTDVKKTEITLPATVLSEIEQKTDASLVISTPHADVSFQNSGLSTLSNRQDVVVATERSGNALKLSITVGGQPVERVPGGVVLTTSVDRSTPGTVAVLVHENGSRQVIRKSLANGSTITIPLDSSARLEIIDNAKVFTDVSVDNWAADAVAFVSGHELFSGTGSDTFSPDLPMTRGMLAVVLHNLENNPAQPGAGMFSDVASDAWYSDAVTWAAAQGIVSGYGNGLFGPGDNITREQLAVMLWRYAGEPAATNKELHFSDANEISGYALEALKWTVENGVVNGKDDNILDPKGCATRAQVAQVFMNYLKQ